MSKKKNKEAHRKIISDNTTKYEQEVKTILYKALKDIMSIEFNGAIYYNVQLEELIDNIESVVNEL